MVATEFLHLLQRRGKRIAAYVEQCDVHARLREHAGQAEPDTRTRAGDDCDAILEILHRNSPGSAATAEFQSPD